MRTFISVTAALALCLAASASAQTYTVLHEFAEEPADGGRPTGGVVSDGSRLYGTTYDGGADDEGAIYALNLDGSGFTVLHSFGPLPDGTYPNGGLALDNGVLYGTTGGGGASDEGTIYSIKTDGTGYAILYNFAPDAWGEKSPVVVSGDMMYGLIEEVDTLGGDGIAYSIKTDGTGYAVATTFAGSPLDGSYPWGKLLLEDGMLYGATARGGKYYVEAGTLFSMSPGGTTHTNLHEFSGSDGAQPVGGLVSDGSRLYGMTGAVGGFYYGYTTGGTVFAVDKDGANFQTLRTFDSGAAPSPIKTRPFRSLYCSGLAMDGTTLYGTTFTLMGLGTARSLVGDVDPGTIFALNTDGTGYTELYRFDGVIQGTGSFPTGTLLLANGTLYGAALLGGAEDMGVVYSYAVPPAPPVDLAVNKSTFFMNDWIAVRANISVITTSCYLFVRIVTPDGQTLYYERGKGLRASPTPYLGFPGTTTVTAPIWDYPILSMPFSADDGTYYLEGGAIDAATGQYIGTVDRKTLIVE